MKFGGLNECYIPKEWYTLTIKALHEHGMLHTQSSCRRELAHSFFDKNFKRWFLIDCCSFAPSAQSHADFFACAQKFCLSWGRLEWDPMGGRVDTTTNGKVDSKRTNHDRSPFYYPRDNKRLLQSVISSPLAPWLRPRQGRHHACAGLPIVPL